MFSLLVRERLGMLSLLGERLGVRSPLLASHGVAAVALPQSSR